MMRTKSLPPGACLVLFLAAGCGGADAPSVPGSLIWAKGAGGTGSGDDFGGGVAVLSDDSVVLTGRYEGTATFGAGESNETSLTSAGETDIFVARYGADGSLVWAKSAGSAWYDLGHGVAALDDDSVVVAGDFGGVATFGPGESNEIDLTPEGLTDMFLARYNPDGTLAWATGAGGAGNDYGCAVAVHSDGSSVVQGWFEGSATFGKGELNVTTLDSAGDDDIFIARFDADGALLWAKHAGGTGWDQGTRVAVFSDGSVLVTGRFAGTADFGPGTTLTSAGGIGDIYLALYDKDGAISWAKRAGGTGWDSGIGLAVLPDGSIFLTGSFESTATFGPGEGNQTVLASAGIGDVFLARCNPDGTLDWVKSAGGPGDDSGKHVALLSDGSAVIAGSFGDPGGDATFGPGEANETTLQSAGWSDIFVACYDSDGGLVWARRAGGSDSDQANCVAVLSDDSVVVTGWFYDTATFGQGEPNETTLTSPVARDIFVARYECVSPTATPFGGGCSPQMAGDRSRSRAAAWFVPLLVLAAAVALLRRAPCSLRE